MSEDGDDAALPEHLRKGRRGEEIAARYLREKGWEIEATNFENEYGEIDIVARREVERPGGTMIAFVEVKARSSPGPMSPELGVTADKRRKITKMARHYDQVHGRARTGYRFDVIGIDLSCSPPEIRHFDGAFDASGNPY